MRVVSAVYDCAPSLSPALRSLHGRPGCFQVALDQIDLRNTTDLLPLSPSLSPSIPADDEAYALIHGGASSTSPSTSLRPKAYFYSYSYHPINQVTRSVIIKP